MLPVTRKIVVLSSLTFLLLAAAMADGGCVGALRQALSPTTPTPLPATPTAALPTFTATPVQLPATPTPDHVDLIFNRPREAGGVQNSAIHVVTGTITYNGEPAVGYAVLVDTAEGCEYGNKTNSEGYYQVTFRDDGSPTYAMKITNDLDIVLYKDKTRRPVSQAGPINVKIESPPSNQITVSITPPNLP